MEGNVGGGNHIARLAFNGLDHAAVIVLEKDVIDFFKLGVNFDRFALFNRADRAEGNALVPAGELLMRARRHFRRIERIAFFDDLGADQIAAVVELVRQILALVRSDHARHGRIAGKKTRNLRGSVERRLCIANGCVFRQRALFERLSRLRFLRCIRCRDGRRFSRCLRLHDSL